MLPNLKWEANFPGRGVIYLDPPPPTAAARGLATAKSVRTKGGANFPYGQLGRDSERWRPAYRQIEGNT